MERLKGKVCLVTGGAHGIGHATSARLAREGAFVAVTDLDEDDGKVVVDDIVANGGVAEFWHLDVTDEREIETVFGEVEAKWGRLDVLVNNAGIAGPDKPTDELSKEDWQKVLEVNVTGVFLCTKAAVPLMRSSGDGGSIVNLSSIYGIVGAPDVPPYHASKGAVREMSKTDAILYAKEGIRVNSVHPGFIWTSMVKGLAEKSGEGVDEFRAALADRHPVGHVGEPDDIAAGIAYLASGDAKFVTGSELVIDGGYTAQ